jgi:hypothetical protein
MRLNDDTINHNPVRIRITIGIYIVISNKYNFILGLILMSLSSIDYIDIFKLKQIQSKTFQGLPENREAMHSNDRQYKWASFAYID